MSEKEMEVVFENFLKENGYKLECSARKVLDTAMGYLLTGEYITSVEEE